jgi:hypothetical protein
VKVGGRLSVYMSQALAADLEQLRACYPRAPVNQIVRRALQLLAAGVRDELHAESARSESRRLAHERLWN